VSLPPYGLVDVPGGRIVFQVIGNVGRVPVLFVHGGPGGSSCSYQSSFNEVKQHRQIILYDQLGSGYSERIQDLEQYANLSRFVTELKALRQQLGFKKFHLVAHSWGAAVALEYLLTEKDEDVLSVVFIGPLFSSKQWLADTDELLKTIPDKYQQAVSLAKSSDNYNSPDFIAAEEAYWTRFVVRTPREQLSYRDCSITPPGDSGLYNYMWGPAEFILKGTLSDYERIDRLSEIKIPTLFLIGQFDEVRQDTALEFQSLVPGSSLSIIPNSGHMINLDQPEKFNRVLDNFFKEVEAH